MKTDPRIDAYIAAAAPFAQPILHHLRRLIHAACPGVTETIKWGSPNFGYEGKILCFLVGFKQHAAFGFWHQGMRTVVARDRGSVKQARGLLGRLTSLDDLPDDKTLRRYIKAAMELTTSSAPARPKPREKKTPPLPADFSGALKLNSKSRAFWQKLPPGARREYLEWILEAKRPATRATRIETSIAWLAEGKKRNWKYEAC